MFLRSEWPHNLVPICKFTSMNKHAPIHQASCSILTSSTQRTMIVNNRFQASHSIYNSRQHRCSVDNSCGLRPDWRRTGGRVNLCIWNQNIYQGDTREGSEWTRESAFHSNCGSVVLNVRDMTMGRTTDVRRTTDRQPRRQPSKTE